MMLPDFTKGDRNEKQGSVSIDSHVRRHNKNHGKNAPKPGIATVTRPSVIPTLVQAQCSLCEQTGIALPNVPHTHCRGLARRIVEKLPEMFKALFNPNKHGVWRSIENASPEFAPAE